MSTEESSKSLGKIKTYFRDEIVFDSDFDSANLSAVVEIPKSEFDYEFNLWTAPDCAGTEYENPNRYLFILVPVLSSTLLAPVFSLGVL